MIVVSGAFAGLIAGTVATWIMDRFQYNWWDVAGWIERWRGRRPVAAPPSPTPEPPRSSATEEFSGPSTAKVANWVFRRWKGRNLSADEKGPAGEIVHYAFGIASAILYGALVALFPAVSFGWGIGFGVALFVIVDELGLWAIGLAKGPWNYALSIHVYALAAHVVYGLSLESGRYLMTTLVLT